MQLLFYQACYMPCSDPGAVTTAAKTKQNKNNPCLHEAYIIWTETK